MLKKIAIAVVVLIAAVLAYAATKPDVFHLERSARIDAPPEKIFPLIDDFRRWQAWSPWEKLDPNLKRTYGGATQGKGAVYEWTGNADVGRGRMEIVEATAPSKVKLQLDFYEPFEAHNLAEFRIIPQGGATDVVWSMEGPNPFLSKVISVFVDFDALVGKDFETGLANLKAQAELIEATVALELHSHPFAAFCQKVLIALYENDTPFEPHLVDLGNAESRAAFYRLWPIGKMPVLRDTARDCTIPESTIIIEYLAQHYPGKVQLIPADPDLARQARLRDRFYDSYVAQPMQKIVTDRLRPADSHDPFGVDEARAMLRTAYGLIEQEMATRTWAMGDDFGVADCAAAPALFYANLVVPLEGHASALAYLRRLEKRPSFARVVEEARPYFANFPR